MNAKVLSAKDSSRTPTAKLVIEEERSSTTSVVDSSGLGYRPVKELGLGGKARVVLAQSVGSSGFSKLVVLRMLHRHLADDPAAREMFEAEARLSARLNHPNLVQVYEVVDGDIPFSVMEYLDGKPLSRVSPGGAITQGMLLTIVAEALAGLHHAHELSDFDGTPLNIVHRDISPHNIFVTYDGAVKVLDFGIPKTAGAASYAVTSEVKGKAAYMAPEQLLGQKVDRRADIFAVGCILWEAAVGGRIWGEMSDADVMHRLATGEIPRPDDHSGMDPRLEQIVTKATATLPEERYATALDLQLELTAYIAERWEPCSLHDIGAALAQTFKDERERNRRLIGSAVSGSLTATADAGSRSRSGAHSAVSVRPPRRGRWLMFPAAGLTILAALTILHFRPKEQPIAASAAPEQAVQVHILVRATPPQAAIEIDGSPGRRSPVSFDAMVDAREHSIRASAPGYLPEVRTLNFSRDLEVDISLERLAPIADPAPNRAIVTASPARVEAPRRVVVLKPKSSAPAEETSTCSPPYYFSNGIKTFKPECL
jgi:eukaryotic-like serine/threonine-protein kinase